MARGVNKVILVGNCGQDPETRYTANGVAITNVSVATSETWKDKQSGQQQERTEWHRVVFFNKLAEIAGEYLRKGSKVYIEGSLRTRKWQGQDGQDRYTTEVVASDMQMLDSRGSGDQGGYGGGMNDSYGQGGGQAGGQGMSQGGGAPRNQAPNRADPNPAPAPDMDSFDDDIPF